MENKYILKNQLKLHGQHVRVTLSRPASLRFDAVKKQNKLKSKMAHKQADRPIYTQILYTHMYEGKDTHTHTLIKVYTKTLSHTNSTQTVQYTLKQNSTPTHTHKLLEEKNDLLLLSHWSQWSVKWSL